MVDARRIFGNEGERLAAAFLQEKGYKILERQYTTRFGEIDLVARDGDEIVFVEVKTRKTLDFGFPEESVTGEKLEKIMRVGEWYLQQVGLSGADCRVDVIAIHGLDIKHFKGVGA